MEISLKDLLNEKNSNIIDIRDSSKYNLGHIKGAMNIFYYDLLNNHQKYLDRNKKYFLYCDYGNTSKIVSMRLNKYGYDTVSISGGYNNYLLRK